MIPVSSAYQAVTGNLDNREIAILCWIALFFAWALAKKNVRDAFVNVIKTLFARQIVIVFAGLFTTIALIAFALNQIGLWDFSLLKDTIKWGLFVAPVMVFRSVEESKQEKFLKKIFLGIFAITAFFEVLVNFYVFSFFVEMIVVPSITLFAVMQAVAQTKEEFKPVATFFDYFFIIIGIVLVAWVVYQVIKNFDEFFAFETLKTVILPVLLSTLLIPFLYLLALWTAYEDLFATVKISRMDKNPGLYRFAKKQIFLTCKLGLKRVNALHKQFWTMEFRSEEEIRKSLKKFGKQFR